MNSELVIVKPEPGVSDNDNCNIPAPEHPIIKSDLVKIKEEAISSSEIYVKIEPQDSDAPWDAHVLSPRPDSTPDDGAECAGRSYFESALQLANGVVVPDHFLSTFVANNPIREKCCHTCDKKFSTNSSLQRHLELHGRIKLSCQICNKEFTQQKQLDKHIAKHNRNKDERLYPCDECDKKFKSSSNLSQHKRVHLAYKQFHCEVCQRSFVNKGNLVKHQSKTKCRRPTDEPLFCNVCNKEFKKEFLLRSHLKKHTTEKPFTCDLCGMNFKYKSTIIRHLQWHTGRRPYKCHICNKKFTHSGLIKPHMRVHTGEKPYQCSICFKYFAHKHNMERHKVNHGRIKRLVCDICNKKFPRESRLIYHMRTHTNEKHFVCHLCNKRFSHKQNILRHFDRKHPGSTYIGNDTDAKVALKVWDRVKHTFEPHFDMYQHPEEILGSC